MLTYDRIGKLAESADPYIKEVYSLLKGNITLSTIAGDSVPLVKFKSTDVEKLSEIAYDHVKARHLNAGITFEDVNEARTNTFLKIAGDSLINKKTGIGTMLDPQIYSHSTIPVMLGPFEASNLYSSGGLPALIVDKKSTAMVLQGATFKALEDFWDNDKINQLEEAAAVTGFNDSASDAFRDAFLYGGSILYPVFKKDSPSSFLRELKDMHLEKGCVDRWVTVDRWNITYVPSFIITDRDYLRPKTLLLPQTSVEVSTSRMAILKPKTMPYWASLYNLGWAPSDMSGWIRAYYGYETTMQSVPVMAQQMSLLLYRMPLDALNATLGPDKVKELMKINEDKMSEWSALSPKAVNMVGEVEVVDRTYSGFDQFVGSMKSELASQCGIPEPSLWHTPNKGFSDNTQESLLKQSETLQLLQKYMERNMGPCTEALIAHVFGTDSEEWNHRETIKMSFNKPIISTEKDLAEVGARFAASVSSFAQAGVAPDLSLKLASQFFPTAKITQEMMDEAKRSYEEATNRQLQMGQMKAQMGSGQGNTKASTGAGKTTGSFTKAK